MAWLPKTMYEPKEATMATRFEKGDRVRCINIDGVDILTLGREYTVTSIARDDSTVVAVDGGPFIYANRFELVSRAEKAPREFCGDADLGACVAVCECGKYRQADRVCGFRAKAEKSLPKGAQRVTYTEATVRIGEVEYPRCPARYAKTAGAEPTRCTLPTRHARGCAFNHDGHNTTDLQSALDRINHLELVAEEERVRAESERQRANRLGDECGSLRRSADEFRAIANEYQTRLHDAESRARSDARTIARLREEIRRMKGRAA